MLKNFVVDRGNWYWSVISRIFVVDFQHGAADYCS